MTGWWDEWGSPALQTQDSKFWRSDAEHVTSRSRMFPTILSLYQSARRKHFYLKPECQSGGRAREPRLSRLWSSAPAYRSLEVQCIHLHEYINMIKWIMWMSPFGWIHCLHDFAHKQDSQLNSSVLITVWRVVIEVWQDSQLNSSAFSHCSVWRVAIGKGVLYHFIFGINFIENLSCVVVEDLVGLYILYQNVLLMSILLTRTHN